MLSVILLEYNSFSKRTLYSCLCVTLDDSWYIFINLQIQSVVDGASGNKGTTRDQAKALVGSGGLFVSSGKKFTSLFYSNHSVIRKGAKEIASGDPRVCLLPGSSLQALTVDEFSKNSSYKSLPSCFGGGGRIRRLQR